MGTQKFRIFTHKSIIFTKNVNFRLFENDDFLGGYDDENEFYEESTLWMSLLAWIRVKITHTQLSITFFHYNRPYRPIY